MHWNSHCKNGHVIRQKVFKCWFTVWIWMFTLWKACLHVHTLCYYKAMICWDVCYACWGFRCALLWRMFSVMWSPLWKSLRLDIMVYRGGKAAFLCLCSTLHIFFWARQIGCAGEMLIFYCPLSKEFPGLDGWPVRGNCLIFYGLLSSNLLG